jgi:hypothetical protein
MSILKFELKQEHFKLLTHLKCMVKNNEIIVSIVDNKEDDDVIPLTKEGIYEYIDVILNGKPTGFDPLNSEIINTYSPEQKAEWDILFSELSTAIEIILQTGKFELGNYKCTYHLRDWKKTN